MEADISVSTVGVCNRERNCYLSEASTEPDGCRIDVKIGEPQIDLESTTADGSKLKVWVPIDDTSANIPVNVFGDCHLPLGKHSNATFAIQVTAELVVNPCDGNTELYVGGGDANKLSINLDGLNIPTTCKILGFPIAQDTLKSALYTAVSERDALTCRGCNSLEDCGAGATQCLNNRCRDASSRKCQGLQLGADIKLDAQSLLQSFDPSAEGVLGVRAFLGQYVTTNATETSVQTGMNGLQFGGRIGDQAAPDSLCVPFRESPITDGLEDCRDGSVCLPLDPLNTSGSIIDPATGKPVPYHIGAGVGMGALNQVLWSAYSSGILCLSIGGETPGLEMLSTSLVSAFISSLSSLTYGVDQAIMIQVRPQQAPRVEFLPNAGQGAEILVALPELEIDFYTMVDHRYTRIFTLGADIELPLGVKADAGQVAIALGSLTNVIDPASVKVSSVEMVSRVQVESLVRNLPSLIGALTGVLGDDIIPPIAIPSVGDLAIEFIGPGVTIINENGLPAALGLFLGLALEADADEEEGEEGDLEPVIESLQIDVRDPKELRADLVARRLAEESFSYQDLMPTVVAHVGVAGAGIPAESVEFSYSINNGPWSFWERGPRLVIDNPILAVEAAFDIRISARAAGNAASGTATYASFQFVNDYTAPNVDLAALGSTVRVLAQDNVYSVDELSMQYRFDGGAWSSPGPLADLEILPQLLDGPVVVDVAVTDPSGNGRTVRRSFGASTQRAAATPQAAAEGGCSSTSGSGGLLACLALLGLVAFRRRDRALTMAASPAYVALAVLAICLLGMSTSGCGKKEKACNPGCDSASICHEGSCEPIACTDDEGCVSHDTCEDGFCVSAKTCSSADDCQYGNICKEGVCKPSECSESSECSATDCSDGLLPFCEYDDYVDVEAGECVCGQGVAEGQHGSWLNVVPLDGGQSAVALAYSEQFGDLIFGTLQADGTFDWSFIDGVPAGPVDRPPSGPRGGVIAAGDEAGRYVSVVLEENDAGSVLHAAYQYRKAGAAESSLRYARGSRSGSEWTWTHINVDDLDVSGNFPSIFLTHTPAVEGEEGEETQPAGGGVGIVYATRDIAISPSEDDPAVYYSEVRVAYANTLEPEDESAFDIVNIHAEENPVPCGGLCDAKSFCATAQNVCVARATGCEACGDGEVCTRVDGNATCVQATAPGPVGFRAPRSVGLFASSVVDAAGTVHTEYYDQVHRNLVYAKLPIIDGLISVHPDGWMIVDGEVEDSEGRRRSTGDVGRWTRIHISDQNDVVIFYEDVSRAQLRGAVIRSGAVQTHTLDSGRYVAAERAQVQSNRVGASIFSCALADGGFEVFYQDATNSVVRRIVWTDLSEAPTGHPYAVFGSEEALSRDLIGEATALDITQVAVANGTGAFGFFTNVVNMKDRTLFASKQLSSPAGSSRVVGMSVGTGFIEHPSTEDGEEPDTELTP